MTFAYPWLLLGWLALLWWGWRWRRRYTYLWLRLLSLALLLLALAQPHWQQPLKDIALLIDRSDSVGQDALALADTLADNFSPQTKATLRRYHFAADTVPEQARRVPVNTARGETDIARALHVAHANGAGRIVLISDGIASRGDARLAVADIPIDTLHVASRNNIRLEQLYVPEYVQPKQLVEATAIIQSNSAAAIVLYPELNGEALDPIPYTVQVGENAVPLRFFANEAGGMTLNVRFESNLPQPSLDDKQQAYLSIRENQKVLVIGDAVLHQLLQEQGFSAVLAEAGALRGTLEYSAIVIRASASAFSEGQLKLLKRYVQEGGGLLMTGGSASFGLGGWYRTPVEDVLAVNSDLRSDVLLPMVALVMVIDKSNSMAAGRPAKIELAKEGAIRVVELAHEQDRIGLMTFSNGYNWVFQPRRASRAAKQAMIEAILNIDSEGGTVLEPAYHAALEHLQQNQAAIKHIIILSDGQLNDEGEQSNLSLLAQGGEVAGISTSTIALGSRADFVRLEAIAQAGGGRYYAAMDANALPQIFMSEALTATRALVREGAITPLAQSHPLLATSVQPPNLEAYVATRLKKDSEMLLAGLDNEPILAVSRQGLGRSAALTTDLSQWAGDFGTWSELPTILSTLMRWLQSNPNDYTSSVSLQADGRLRISVDAVREGAYVQGAQLRVRYQGEEKALTQRSLGRYEGMVEQAVQGGEALILQGDAVIARVTVPNNQAEFAQGNGQQLLAQLSQLSGGQVIDDLTVPYQPVLARARRPLQQPFLLLALALLLLELVLRRFGHAWLAQLPANLATQRKKG